MAEKITQLLQIYNNFTLNKTVTTYKVYVWLDQALEDTSNLSEEVYSGFVHAEAIAKSTVLPLATDAIMALATDDACQAGGTGLCATNSYTDTDGTTKYHDYRFRGGEGVNNFVSFNNDLYRIIGIFDSNSHGVEGQYLIKLISANELSANSWGAYNSSATSGTYSNYANDWTGNTTGVKANLNILLNEYFYNKTNTSSTYGSCSNWTYYSNNNDYKTYDCTNIVGYGIDSGLQNYIENVTWYLKGYTDYNYSKQNFYLCERGLSTDTTNCMSGNSGVYDASTTGKIGLMYVSDYMYASSYFADTSTTKGSSQYYGNKNWLYKGLEWTITPDADSATYVFRVYVTGYVNTNHSYYGSGMRPTFYLKSSVYVTGGDGSFSNPYIIACNDCNS